MPTKPIKAIELPQQLRSATPQLRLQASYTYDRVSNSYSDWSRYPITLRALDRATGEPYGAEWFHDGCAKQLTAQKYLAAMLRNSTHARSLTPDTWYDLPNNVGTTP